MLDILSGDALLQARVQADLEFQKFLDHHWGARFMVPHIGTGGYYEIETTRGLEIVSGWEVGPRERYETDAWYRSFRLNRLCIGRLLDSSVPLPQVKYGSIGRMIPCELLYGEYRHVRTPWLKGEDRWDVAKKLWERYGYVLR